MTWQPDHTRAGLTLFEVLVALTLITLVTGVVIAMRPTPSPELRLNAAMSQLFDEASAARLRAVTTGADVVWEADASDCNGNGAMVVFFADGTATESSLCVTIDDRNITLIVDPLTGRVREDAHAP